jgi:hypothetical protein
VEQNNRAKLCLMLTQNNNIINIIIYIMGNNLSNSSNSQINQIIPDSLSCMEEGIPNDLIFTFFIHLHGAIIKLNLTSDEEQLFDICRMFSKTGSTCYSYNNYDELVNNDIIILKEQLQQNLKSSTYDTIDECIQQKIKPVYQKEIQSLSYSELIYDSSKDTKEDKDFIISNCCKTISRINHDKIFTSQPDDSLGIFLLSVHKKELDGSLLYVPIDLKYTQNLLFIDKLQQFARIFGGIVPELNSMSFDRKKSLNQWSGIELSSNREKIEKLKLSKFIEIIQRILKNTRKNCKFNIIDYSCSKYIYNMFKQESITGNDIENKPENKEKFGGKKKSIKKKIFRQRVKKIKKRTGTKKRKI